MKPILPEVTAECAAWFDYYDYVLPFAKSSRPVFTGDETSHALYRRWEAARKAREAAVETRRAAMTPRHVYRWPR